LYSICESEKGIVLSNTASFERSEVEFQVKYDQYETCSFSSAQLNDIEVTPELTSWSKYFLAAYKVIQARHKVHKLYYVFIM